MIFLPKHYFTHKLEMFDGLIGRIIKKIATSESDVGDIFECWFQNFDLGDLNVAAWCYRNKWMLMTEMVKTVTNILNLSPASVTNIDVIPVIRYENSIFKIKFE